MSAASAADRDLALLDLLTHIACDSLEGGIEHHLTNVAKAFDAPACGWIGSFEKSPVQHYQVGRDGSRLAGSFPIDLGDQAASPSAFEWQAPNGKKLLAATHACYDLSAVLWVEDQKERTWKKRERGALILAAMGISRHLLAQKHPGSWSSWIERSRRQQRMDDAVPALNRLAHDFNNVLTGILGFAELSLADLPAGSRSYQFLSEVRKAAEKGTALCRQIGLCSRRRSPAPGSTELYPLLLEETARLRSEPGRAAEILVAVPEQLPHLGISADSLRAILTQLLTNACEAGSAGGTVTVRATVHELSRPDCLVLFGKPVPGTHVEVTIADTGPGFTSEARERIFAQPCFTTKPGHHGLGLAIVYSILAAHRGGVGFEHPASGGTVARFYVPVETAPLSVARSSRTPARAPVDYKAVPAGV
jgi:signal transduction histidine kinase